MDWPPGSSGAPWLLIEMRALVAVYGSAGGVDLRADDVVESWKEADGVSRAARGAGVDVGKGHHWVCLIDDAGVALWSAKVVNDEAAILEAIATLGDPADRRTGRGLVQVDGLTTELLRVVLPGHGSWIISLPQHQVLDSACPRTGVRPQGAARRQRAALLRLMA